MRDHYSPSIACKNLLSHKNEYNNHTETSATLFMRWVFCLLIATGLFTTNSFAQVTAYSFAQSSGTYSAISGGTQVVIGAAWDDGITTALPIGFTFVFNNTSYTTFSLDVNGSIRFGNALAGNYYCPTNYINTGLNTNSVCGYTTDLHGAVATSEVRYQTIGANPNQQLVVQFKNVMHFGGNASDNWTFQIILSQTSNTVQLVWGPTTDVTNNVANTCADINGESGACGLIGANASDANLRVVTNGTTTWATSTAATTVTTTNVCNMSSTNIPASGLTWTWSPPGPCVSAPPAQPTALNLTATGSSGIAGSFTPASGSDGYLVVRYPSGGTPTNPVDGITYSVGNALGTGTVVSSQISPSFTATGLTATTTYDFYVYSENFLCTGGPLYLTSSPLSGSATTLAFTTSSALGGLWSSPATWGGTVPPIGENVVIAAGSIVTIDVAATPNNVTVDGTLQWGTTTFALTVLGNLTISSTGRFHGFSTAGAGQVINLLGNLTNNGYANLIVSALIFGGSGTQTLGGSGTYQGNGTRGLIATIQMQGSGTLNVTVPLNIRTLNPIIGNISGGSNIELDNTQGQVFNQAINTQINNVAVTNMGTGYTTAPVIGGSAAANWVAGAVAAGALRINNGQQYVSLDAIAATAGNAPTHTNFLVATTGDGKNWLHVGSVGVIGIPFAGGSLTPTAGSQYFWNGALYTCVTSAALTIANLNASLPFTTTVGGVVTVGAAVYRCVGTAATLSPNYDATTQTLRSASITSTGSGYHSSPAAVVLNTGAGSGSLIVTLAIPAVAGNLNALIQKNATATLSGTPTINSSQGVGIPTSATGGYYNTAPTVFFSAPSAVNYITLAGADGGAGCTVSPTAAFTGGTNNGGANTFTVTVAGGRIVGLVFSGTALYSSPPTGITFSGGTFTTSPTSPSSGALSAIFPTATAVLNAGGQLTNYTVGNSGGGYIVAPTMALSAPGAGELAAATPTCRVGLYNLTAGFFLANAINGITPTTTNGVHNESTNLAGFIPSNRRINVLSSGASQGINFTGGDITLYNSAPLTLGGGPIDLGGNGLIFGHYLFAGANSTAVSWVQNGSITSNLFGTTTRLFPFRATGAIGALQLAVGTGTAPAGGSDINRVRVTQMGAPSGIATGVTSNMIGTRAFRVEILSGSTFGGTTLPTVTEGWDASDNLLSDNPSLYLCQSNTGLTSDWAVRSAAGLAGGLAVTGTRTTATTGNGPIVFASTMYFAWSSSFTPPPALNYTVTRTTANAYNSIMPSGQGGDGTGVNYTWQLAAQTDEGFSNLIPIPSSTFQYQGSTVTGFRVTTDGYMIVTNAFNPGTPGSGATEWNNAFTTNTSKNIIAAFYDDLTCVTNDFLTTTMNLCMRYKIDAGAPGTRKITAEWWKMTFFGLAGPELYYQVVLDENDNSITFNYGNMQMYNGTQNIRWSYTCGMSGAAVQAVPQAGQVFQQQFENTSAFGSPDAAVANVGANGLIITPEPRSSIKFTPGSYAGYTPPVPTPPVNDEYTGAILLPALTAFPTNIAWNNNTNESNFFTTRYATTSVQPICGGSTTAKDVWLKFDANDPNMQVRIYASGGFVPRVEILDASLNPLSPVQCVLGTVGLTATANMSGLTVGSTYYVRVYHNNTGTTATATATIFNGAVNSVTLTNPGSNYTSCVPPFGYLPPNTTARVTFSGGGGSGAVATANVTTNGVISGLSTLTLQSGGTGYTSAPSLTIESPDYGLSGEFGVIVFAKAVNDECASAITLTNVNNATCVDGQNQRLGVTTAAATASADAAPSCGIADDDVWYKFTATGSFTNVTTTGATNFDPAFEVWNGGPGIGNCATKTLVICVNATGMGGTEATNVITIPGNTYFVRVFDAVTGSGGVGGSFDICVSSQIPSCLTSPISPTNGGTTCANPPLVLSWAAASNASGYDVYFDAGTSATTLRSSNQAGLTFTPGVLITGEGTYAWRVVPRNSNGTASGCSDWTVIVSDPQVTSTTPAATFCGDGSAQLQATGSGGSTLKWYRTSTGGTSIGTGSPFNTPVIYGDSTYYVEAISGLGTQTGLGNTGIPPDNAGWFAQRGIVFDATSTFTLVSAQYYSSILNISNSVHVVLQDNAGVQLQTVTLSIPQGANPDWYTMDLNWVINPGTGYRLLADFTQNVHRDLAANYSLSTYNNLSPVGTITSGWDGGVSPTTYNYLHNISVSAGCSSARVGVLATHTPSTAITVSSGPTSICAGNSTTVSVSSSNLNYNYTWTSTPAGFSQTGTGPFTVNPAVSTTYNVSANDPGTGCNASGNVAISVAANNLSVTANAVPNPICSGGSTSLTATVAGSSLPSASYSLSNLTGQTYTTLSGGGITVINTTGQLTPGMGTGNQDDGGVVITLPFTFTYLGNAFTQMSMCTNGWVGAGNWGTIDAVSMRIAGNLFTSTIPNNTIAAWFKDMGANFPLGTGSMRHGLIGTDVYAFQWDNAVGSGFSDGSAIMISFQINIYGPTSVAPGRIEFIYGPTVGAIAFLASEGIEDATGGTNHYINALDGTGTSTTTSSVWPGSGNGYRFNPIPPPSLTYSWSPSAYLNDTTISNPVASGVMSTTTYTVTATNNTGCSASGSVAVNVISTDATFTGLDPDYCADAGAALLTPVTPGGVFSGTGVILFGTDYYFDPSSSGVGGPFTVTYTTMCANSSQNTSVHSLPVVILDPFSPICTDAGPLLLTGGSPAGGIYFDAFGYVDGTYFYPAAAGAGTHTIFYAFTDPFGCSSLDQQDIEVEPAATVDAGPDQTICAVSDASLSGSFGGSASSASWTTSGDGTFADASSTSTTYSPGLTDQLNGFVTLTLTTNDPAGACGAVSDALVVTLTAATTYYADLDNDGYGAGVPILACVQPPGTSTNNTDCNDSNAAVNPGATDVCNGVDDNCDGTVDENPLVATISPSGTASYCKFEPVTLSANTQEGLSYQWYRNNMLQPGATTSTFITTKKGNFTVAETNGFCSSTSAATTITRLAAPRAVIGVFGNLDICSTGSVLLRANKAQPSDHAYQWNKGGLPISGATDRLFTATSTGDYTVTVSNTNGCSATSSVTTVTSSCKGMQPDLFTAEFDLYPNPTQGNFVVELQFSSDVNSEADVQVINMFGQTVYLNRTAVVNGELFDEVKFDYGVAAGNYFVRVIVGDKVYTGKIVYQK